MYISMTNKYIIFRKGCLTFVLSMAACVARVKGREVLWLVAALVNTPVNPSRSLTSVISAMS